MKIIEIAITIVLAFSVLSGQQIEPRAAPLFTNSAM